MAGFHAATAPTVAATALPRAERFGDGPLTVSWARGSGWAEGTSVAAFAGRLDARGRLARELGLPESTPPARLVAAGYERWEDDLPARLRGAFALAVWRGDRSRGLLAVDRLAAGALFLRAHGSGIVFASELRDLVSLLPTRPAPDDAALVHWLVDGALGPGETLFRGVTRLGGGECVELDAHGSRRRTYRRLTFTRPSTATPEELAREVADSTIASVRDRAEGADHLGVLLSGGLDSTSVAAAATAAGCAPHAYSAVFPAYPATDESGLIAATVRELGLDGARVEVGGSGALRASIEYLDRWKVPSVSPNLFLQLALLRLAREDGASIVLDGQGGDELFGRSPYVVADRLRAGRPRDAFRLARALAGDGATAAEVRSALREYGAKGIVPHRAHRLARRLRRERYAPQWLTPGIAASYVETADPWHWKTAAGPRWWAYLRELIGERRVRAAAHDFLRHAGAMAGVAMAHPLMDDPDLVELALRVPPEIAVTSSLDRPLLRAAFAGRMPEQIRLRPDKSYFNELFHDALAVADWQAVARALGDAPRLAAYIRQPFLRELAATPPQRYLGRRSWLIWRLVSAELWLRTLEDDSFPAAALESWPLSHASTEPLGRYDS